MKRYLSLILSAALLLSVAALTSCDTDIVVNGDNTLPAQTSARTEIPTIGAHAYQTAPDTEEALWRPYAEIEDFDAYKRSHVNLMPNYFDQIVFEQSYFTGYNYSEPGPDESAPNIFDRNPATQWCASSNEADYSAIVWSMTEAVYVSAYSITTGRHSGVYINNPIAWRLYAADELPDAKMGDTIPGENVDYFFYADRAPEGWVLLDAVYAQDAYSTEVTSLIPRLDSYEVGFEVPEPGYYKYFMLLVDGCEGDHFDMGEFSLYTGYDEVNADIDYFPFSYHPYVEIDLQSFKEKHTNLMEQYFDIMNYEHSFFPHFDYQVDADAVDIFDPEFPPNIFDGDPLTKWCCGASEAEFQTSIVWGMTQAVNVSGYTITTGNDNSIYTNRNLISWRLYGTNELPSESMNDMNASYGDTYFETYTVPEGWELIDAVDATDPEGDGFTSLIPDKDLYEVAFEAQNPGSYKYFMFLIDTNEINCVQISEFTLYGNVD